MSSEIASDDAAGQEQDQRPLVVNHPKLTFPDGDIVLLSAVDSKTSKSSRYRVHKHILAVHSSVSKDLFDSCTSSDDPELKLDDAATTLESLLLYMYADGKSIHTPTYTNLRDDKGLKSAFDAILLADKYAVHNFETVLLSSVMQEIDFFERVHPEWNGDERSFADIPGHLSFDYGMHLLAYADKAGKEDLESWALLVGLAALDEGYTQLGLDPEPDLSPYDLSPQAEARFWRFHHSKQQTRAIRFEKECEGASWELRAKTCRLEALSEAPETSTSHELTCAGWSGVAIPAYYRALKAAIKRVSMSFHRNVDLKEMAKEMKSANFGDCQVCLSAIHAHINGIWRK